MKKDTAIFLCDRTGIMGKPWRKARYRIILVDPQHPTGLLELASENESVVKISGTVLEAMPTLTRIVQSGRVAFVCGFPPCTDVALSGARWWEEKKKEDPYFQAKAAVVAEQCRMIGILSGAPWIFEQPKSSLGKIMGAPSYKFHPYHFTSLCKRDNYKKETWLWSGGGFRMPGRQRDYTLGPPDDRIHKAGGEGIERQNFRSKTPKGFAVAVFEANRQKEE